MNTLLGICIVAAVLAVIWIAFLAYCICRSCGQADDYDEQTKGIRRS